MTVIHTSVSNLYIFPEILLAYLLGSVPSAVWVGKLFYHTDVRQHGSGNAGATNVIRVLGYKAGIPVLLFDIFKGWAAVQLFFLFPHAGWSDDFITWLRICLAFAAVLGHVFPVFAGFKGGKGVGTLAGTAIALYPLALLIVLALFIINEKCKYDKQCNRIKCNCRSGKGSNTFSAFKTSKYRKNMTKYCCESHAYSHIGD